MAGRGQHDTVCRAAVLAHGDDGAVHRAGGLGARRLPRVFVEIDEVNMEARVRARDLRVGLGLMTEGDTLIVGSYLGQAEKGSTYSVIEYIGSDTELIIPAFIEGCRVTKFNQRILEDMDSLRILSVPAGFVVEPTLVPEGAQVVVRPQV